MLKLVYFLLPVIITASPSLRTPPTIVSYFGDDETELLSDQKWIEFKSTYNKSYESNLTEMQRAKIFQANLQRIDAENAHGKNSYTLGINQFSDMTPEEFSSTRKSFGLVLYPEDEEGVKLLEQSSSYLGIHEFDGNESSLPTSVDWRKSGAVTPVKNQGNCGSCWAFSTTGALEGIMKIKSGKLVSLSEQQIATCHGAVQFPPLLPGACSGGSPGGGFAFAEKHGICTEKSYEYVGNKDEFKCLSKGCSIGIPKGKVKGYKGVAPLGRLIPASTAALMSAVAQQPISVGVQADSDAFMHYKSGILSGTCGESDAGMVDHAILLVGYGTDEKLGDYWLVKNSWGTSWGEEGYVRLARGKNEGSKWGACHVRALPSYPILNN
eukprot:g6315.t1